MPRKGHIAKRTVAADAVYGSDLVTKFINSMMWQGKRSTAEGIFYEALQRVEAKGGDTAIKLFTKAVERFPQGRPPSAGEVADVAVFLAADATQVTGQTVSVNGGLSFGGW